MAAGEVTAGLTKSNVMAAYHRVKFYDFGHLPPDCRGPGSAPEFYTCLEYGTTFRLYLYTAGNTPEYPELPPPWMVGDRDGGG